MLRRELGVDCSKKNKALRYNTHFNRSFSFLCEPHFVWYSLAALFGNRGILRLATFWTFLLTGTGLSVPAIVGKGVFGNATRRAIKGQWKRESAVPAVQPCHVISVVATAPRPARFTLDRPCHTDVNSLNAFSLSKGVTEQDRFITKTWPLISIKMLFSQLVSAARPTH